MMRGSAMLRALALALSAALLCGFMTQAQAATIRGGEHPTFSRLVVDWSRPVDYSLARDGDRVTVTFTDRAEDAAELDLAAVTRSSLSRIKAFRQEVADGRLILSFTVAGPGELRHFREGTKVVVDVMDVGGAPAQKTTPAAPGTDAKPKPDPAPEQHAAKPEPKPAPRTPSRAELGAPRGQGLPVVVQYEPIFNGLRLSYPMAEALPAAAFIRAGHLWVVIEKARPVDHGALAGVLGDRIKTVEQVPHPHATVLRYGIAPGQHAVVHRRDGTWLVELKDNRTAPQIPIVVTQVKGEGGKPHIFLPVSDVGSRIDLRDPAVGDEIAVVPVLPPGRGVIEDRRFAEFGLMQTAQGVAVEFHADGVEVARYRNGVALAAAGGLALTADATAGAVPSADGAHVVRRPQRMIDFASWARGGREDFARQRDQLLRQLSLAKPDERNSARWELARFYLAHGFPDRTLGILALMAESDPSLLESAEFRAIRGIAHVQMGRHAEAEGDLSHKGLVSEVEIYLWRAMAAEGLGAHEEALAHYLRGRDVLADHDEVERARFKLAAARAAAALDQREILNDELSQLAEYNLPPALAAEADFLRGRALVQAGDNAAARDVFARVIASGDRRNAARARLARVELDLAEQAIAPRDAIEQLEGLRHAWRGDEFELDLLERLGRLHMEVEDYRTGLLTLQQAVTHFENSARTRAITELMGQAFRELFLAGKADALPPLQALSLYYDFRELTPLGADGDLMIRRLADRLVSVDLLDRAAELLEHQVRYRLEGVARATVATRLAMIYLMDRKPEQAVAVMRATRQIIIPDDIETRRRHLEARALIDLGRFEEAEVMLAQDQSRTAHLLRADLYWAAARWKDVVANGETLLGERWNEAKPLTNDERRQVLRLAVAMSLDENREGLAILRDRYGRLMQDGAYASAFEVITARQEPSVREIKALTESIASVNTLESFMASYRQEFRGS